jgi:hypothetical protein
MAREHAMCFMGTPLLINMNFPVYQQTGEDIPDEI